ncbi:putative glucanase GlgE [Mycobacterium intracellulare MIN_061107_1834]|nr:putative glucanase GlgE [Mycobacterium intracellulare MIN_061107_1834]
MHGLPSASHPPVERGNISYQEPNLANGRSTQTLYCSPRVTKSRSGCSARISSISGPSASAVRVTGSPGVRSAAAAASSGSRRARGTSLAARSNNPAPTRRSLDSSFSP